MESKFVGTHDARLVSQSWCISIDDNPLATESPKGDAVLLFSTRELAELCMERGQPKMPETATPVLLDLVTFIPDCARLPMGHAGLLRAIAYGRARSA